MTMIYKTYANNAVRAIEVVSVSATDDPQTLLLNTASEGSILLCQTNDPVLWQQVIDAGLIDG